MFTRITLGSALVAGTLLFATGTVHASRIRYHYVPSSDGGAAVLTPTTSGGAPGERLSWVGRAPVPFDCAPRPTQNVAFTHPCTGQSLVVPLALPLDATPRIEHRPRGVSYNYGSDSIDINFLPDGSVNVTYDSGFIRRPYTQNGP